jgi:hypothetical protein
LLRRVALAARFRHAVWGPDELFYGELYASRRVPCRPTLARPGTRDAYSACVARELVRDDAYDFLLFSLPDNDHHTHVHGTSAMIDSVQEADLRFGEYADAAGGVDAFLDRHAVILMGDHGQTDVRHPLPLAEVLGGGWRVLRPNDEHPERSELAVSPSARAGAVYLLTEGSVRTRADREVRTMLRDLPGVELVASLRGPDGAPLERHGSGAPAPALEASVERGGSELRFRPGGSLADLRGVSWDVEGDLSTLGLELGDGAAWSRSFPDALGRLWAALTAPHAGDVLLSLSPGYECVDWGGAWHVDGGSHGSLRDQDSLVPLVLVGLDGVAAESRRQWRLTDVAELVTAQFGSRALRSEAGTVVGGAG